MSNASLYQVVERIRLEWSEFLDNPVAFFEKRGVDPVEGLKAVIDGMKEVEE